MAFNVPQWQQEIRSFLEDRLNPSIWLVLLRALWRRRGLTGWIGNMWADRGSHTWLSAVGVGLQGWCSLFGGATDCVCPLKIHTLILKPQVGGVRWWGLGEGEHYIMELESCPQTRGWKNLVFSPHSMKAQPFKTECVNHKRVLAGHSFCPHLDPGHSASAKCEEQIAPVSKPPSLWWLKAPRCIADVEGLLILQNWTFLPLMDKSPLPWSLGQNLPHFSCLEEGTTLDTLWVNRAVFVLLHLAYFAECHTVQVHPPCRVRQDFLLSFPFLKILKFIFSIIV